MRHPTGHPDRLPTRVELTAARLLHQVNVIYISQKHKLVSEAPLIINSNLKMLESPIQTLNEIIVNNPTNNKDKCNIRANHCLLTGQSLKDTRNFLIGSLISGR